MSNNLQQARLEIAIVGTGFWLLASYSVDLLLTIAVYSWVMYALARWWKV